MKVLFAASEVTPLAKVGGLADVIGSLPHALAGHGHEVRVVLPQYGCIDTARYSVTKLQEGLSAPMADGAETFALTQTNLKDGTRIYLVNNRHFTEHQEVYGVNDLCRYVLFATCCREALRQLDWQPDIVHCHDWHAALLVRWLRNSRYRTVFTIHNLAYQGALDETFLTQYALTGDWAESPPGAPKPPLNLMGQGILWADLVTTVSETYAKEILTPELGAGLDHLLRYRQDDLIGIINGLDYDSYNPATDPHLKANYDASSPEIKAANKLALQQRTGLPVNREIPLIGLVQRLDEQKGVDILGKALPAILEAGAQVVVLGRGRETYESMLRQIAVRYPGQLFLDVDFDDAFARLIYAGADMFLMPSLYEPCGLGQLIAMRYGALPVVRRTGGLADTVAEFSPDLAAGSGFVFKEYASEALLGAVKAGLEAFRNRPAWRQAVQRVMQLDFSWRASAAKYAATYERIVAKRR